MKQALITKDGETTDLTTIEKYINESQQRVLKVLTVLAGHDITGLSTTQIANTLNATTTSILRDLRNLEVQGFVERTEHDQEKWRHGIAIRRMFHFFSNGLVKNIEKTISLAFQTQHLN